MGRPRAAARAIAAVQAGSEGQAATTPKGVKPRVPNRFLRSSGLPPGGALDRAEDLFVALCSRGLSERGSAAALNRTTRRGSKALTNRAICCSAP